MAKDYKAIIKDKRLEAGKLMTEDQIGKCNAAIHIASVASGASGAIPIPVADAVPISAAQISMVIALGKIFDQEITSSVAKGIIGAAASTFVGRNLVKIIPIVGWAASAVVAAGVTEAIGWMVATDMAKNYRNEYERQQKAKEAAEAFAEAEAAKRASANSNPEAEDFSDFETETQNFSNTEDYSNYET